MSTTEGYDPSSTEAKWRKKWEDAGVYRADLAKAKKPYYSMVMFPYPSGDKLHVGHWYNYAPADSYARFKKMQGYDVFAPMGFDAFGLPAENYAIKTGVKPAESTAKNVKTMIEQLKRIGCMYDWDKTLSTTDPDYYRWTQWLFLEMYKHKLAYKKLGNVNFCPSCQTVLANEQAQDGKCERCGTEVIQKPLDQWYWNIKKYSQALLDGLTDLDWPEKTKLMQRNWIGRSEGAEISFKIDGHDKEIVVFTTRPDTLFGVTYLVLAPEHSFVEEITTEDQIKVIKKYKLDVSKKTEIDRTSVGGNKTGEPTGAYAIHPVTKEKLPIWIADYALVNYGTGAVMAVPTHDERDWDFSQARGLPTILVIEPDITTSNWHLNIHPGYAARMTSDANPVSEISEHYNQELKRVKSGTRCWTGGGTIINSDFLNGLDVESAKKKMIEWLEKNKKGRGIINYRLRDWLVSRQRYWGAPIPIVYDPEGNAHPVPEEHLPWTLPTDVEFKPTGKSPLTESKEFIARTEKIFGKGWRPEFDTMDTFVCSSFYYLRYLMSGHSKGELPATSSPLPASKTKNIFIDPALEKKWLPVSMYIGGPEHACMHLIYARFVMMALKDFGHVSHSEPFKKLVHQGLITNQGAKMSKSKGNVVSPDSFVEWNGADVFRMYLMFMGPFTDGGDWSDTGIKGISRFVQRMYKAITEKSNKKVIQDKPHVLAVLHKTIQKVSADIESLHFNTAISALMELLNAIEKEESFSEELGKTVTLLLAPLAPHLAEEMWEKLGGPASAKATVGKKDFVVNQSWPTFDPALIVESTVTIVVQVNGKLRGELVVPKDESKESILKQAKELENVQKYLIGELKKEIYVPGKLVSLVV